MVDFLKPIAEDNMDISTCPLCGEDLIWDSTDPSPEDYDWCTECRYALISLIENEDDDGKRIRSIITRGAVNLLSVIDLKNLIVEKVKSKCLQ